MLLVTQLTASRYAARAMMRVAFIACVGARDAAASVALRRAFASGEIDAVRSLQRDDHPDATAWCAGPGWWLSTRPPPY
jgi:protein-L-isoaspartate(D-aspartate) O-methyltransferase